MVAETCKADRVKGCSLDKIEQSCSREGQGLSHHARVCRTRRPSPRTSQTCLFTVPAALAPSACSGHRQDSHPHCTVQFDYNPSAISCSNPCAVNIVSCRKALHGTAAVSAGLQGSHVQHASGSLVRHYTGQRTKVEDQVPWHDIVATLKACPCARR